MTIWHGQGVQSTRRLCVEFWALHNICAGQRKECWSSPWRGQAQYNYLSMQIQLQNSDRSDRGIRPGEATQVNVGEEIVALQQSHAELARKFRLLQSELRNSERFRRNERIAIFNHFQDNDCRAVFRTKLFARLRAVKVLRSAGKELKRKVPALVAANSVVQTALKSPTSDCSLQEFQTLALHLLQDPKIRCVAVPSEYHVRFPHVRHCSKLGLAFETYADLCDALELDAETRESAIYRKRRNSSRSSRCLRAVQVLGVHVQRNNSRSVLLGRSYLSESSEDTIPCLHQNTTAWTEGTWEKDFSFLRQSRNAIFGSLPPSVAELHSAERERKSFALIWERIEFDGTSFPSLHCIPGSLRSCFPAVVIRTRILTESTRAIFDSCVSLRQLTSSSLL